MKAIRDWGQKQVEVLKDLNPKEQAKLTEGESNNQPKAAIIFSNVINERNNNNEWLAWQYWVQSF